MLIVKRRAVIASNQFYNTIIQPICSLGKVWLQSLVFLHRLQASMQLGNVRQKLELGLILTQLFRCAIL